MHLPRLILTFSLLSVPTVLADCLTPTYPDPVDLSSEKSLVAATWKNLSSIFEDYFKSPNSSASTSLSGIEDVTFSVGLFSLHDPAATQLQYHHTAAEVLNATVGTNRVDANSIYRVASVSKLVTTFTGLVAMAEEDWNRPLADIMPDLGQYFQANSKGFNPIYNISWDQITPWTLATQLSGIPTLGWPGADFAVEFAQANISASDIFNDYGFPPVNVSVLGPCATELVSNPNNEFCSAPDGIKAVESQAPNFLPWTTPAYSDLNFMLLGIAISNITGKPLSNVYRDSVFGPLGMNSTYDFHPTSGPSLANSVVLPGFAQETSFTTPSGGILSTISDLTKLGTAILNNTLLSPLTTRKWMKPQTHTASLSYSAGGPWEIHRYIHPGTTKVTDLYTKLGDAGDYGGTLVLIPQYNAGFTLLNAGSNATIRSSGALVVLDYITNAILPALEAQAAVEAQMNYVGTYASADPKLNASVTIAFNKSTIPGITSGLTLTQWIYNSVDILSDQVLFDYPTPRLEPSILKQTPAGRAGQVAFQLSTNIQTLTYNDVMAVPGSGVIGSWTGFYTTNGDWVLTDQTTYGGVGVNMFVFNVDGTGKATGCSPAVDGVLLKRVGS